MRHMRLLGGLFRPSRSRKSRVDPESKSGAVRSLRTHGPRPPWNGASTVSTGGTGTVFTVSCSQGLRSLVTYPHRNPSSRFLDHPVRRRLRFATSREEDRNQPGYSTDRRMVSMRMSIRWWRACGPILLSVACRRLAVSRSVSPTIC